MTKWERINELEVQGLENMVEFSTEGLTWTKVNRDQVAITPYCQLDDFIRGEESSECAPTQFILQSLQSNKVEDIKHIFLNIYVVLYVSIYIYFQHTYNFSICINVIYNLL